MSLFVGEDSRCDRCRGSGDEPDWNDEWKPGHIPKPCEDCRGTGRRLTEVGRELFDVLATYFDIKPKRKTR